MGIIGTLRGLILCASAKSPRFPKTIGELQNEPLSAWGNDDIIEGLQFSATLQLRTPLRVLLRHGEIHTEKRAPPPRITKEAWEGLWTPKTESYRSLGIDVDEVPVTCASDVGPVSPGDYLPFLIALRKTVELDEPIEERIKKLRTMPIRPEWQTFVESYGARGKSRHRGLAWVIEYFFPRFINTIPKLTEGAVRELAELGLDTPDRIAAAPDETLLGIKGIGLAKLQLIRDYCAGITKNRDADRIENVGR